jgi:hypothetical protein
MLDPVDAEVGLPVTVQIELAHRDAAFNRLLEDPGSHTSPMPHHFSRKSRVNGN